MRSIQEIDRELERTRQKAARLRKLDVSVEDIERQLKRRRITEQEARHILEQEPGDMAELARMSLVAFLARLSGNPEGREAEARRGAAMAKARYDAARWDIEDLERLARDARREREQLRDVPQQYQALLKEKETMLRSREDGSSRRLGEFAQKLEHVAGELREIQEAVQAGLTAQQALRELRDSLEGAEHWGIWNDVSGAGIMSTFAKHGCLDDVQDAAYEARRNLSFFRVELADVPQELVPDLAMENFIAFADYFFDGLFADLFVRSRIQEARRQVETVTAQVSEMISRLRNERESLEEQQGQLEWERERLATAQSRAQSAPAERGSEDL